MVKKEAIIILAVVVIVIVMSGLIPGPPPAGQGAFKAYWSASYLLASSENFADRDLLLQVEQQLTNHRKDYALVTWNPPWLLALLLPYTLVSFQQATWLWLFTNISLIFISSVLVWQLRAQREVVRRRGWIAPLIAYFFVPTLIAMMLGQVNTLVLIGLAAFLHFEAQEQQVAAGMSLVLTLVKPHLVYITLPLVLLTAVYRRQWRLLLGFGTFLVVLVLIVFALRPTFITDYTTTVTESRLLQWAIPTIGGFLSEQFGWFWVKFIGVIILPLAVVWWWRQRDKLPVMTQLVDVTLLISVITAPFGWGYDVIVFILPILQIVIWVVDGRLPRGEGIGYMSLLLLINIASFIQRSIGMSEVYYFWLPPAIAIIYGIALWRLRPARHDALAMG